MRYLLFCCSKSAAKGAFGGAVCVLLCSLYIFLDTQQGKRQSYEYLAFEDPKPASCEPLQLRSGNAWDNGLWGNVELRDQKVVFFATSLGAGEHVIKYKLRAETPGVFRAMPATGFAMYTPEICGSTTEQTIAIHDK